MTTAEVRGTRDPGPRRAPLTATVARLLPRLVPRAGALAAAAVLAVLAAGRDRVPASALEGLLTVLLLAATLQLRRAARRAPGGTAWRWFARATTAVAAGCAVAFADAVLHDATGHPLPVPVASVVGASVLVGGAFAYAGLTRWNQSRSYLRDPGDHLNGLAAVLAGTGAGNVLLASAAPELFTAWPLWRVEGWLLGCTVLVVLLGAAVTVAAAGRLLRDARLWVLAAAAAGLLAATLLVGRDGPAGDPLLHVCWVAGFVLLAASSLHERPIEPVAISPQTPAVAVVVLTLVSVVVLAVDGHASAAAGILPVVFTGLSVLLVSTRVVWLVRELEDLAASRLQARTDDLTGVANRRALVARLEALAVDGLGAGLLLVDLDRFKEVNDRYGHVEGDDLLRVITRALEAAAPAGSLLARLGGDEFALVVPHGTERGGSAVGRGLVDAVVAVVRADARPLGVGVSVGVAALAPGTLDPDDLLRRADAAMWVAKAAGGGLSVFDAEADAAARDRAALLADLRALLAGEVRDGVPGGAALTEQLVLFYQPQLELASGGVVGVEALVRWRHPERGLLPPVAFLDLVEEHGLMDHLTAFLLHRAVGETRGWSAGGRPLRVSVNLSASSLARPGLLAVVDRALAAGALEPGRLVLEVTETTLMADPALALAVTRDLTARGVQLSIDDYGTGYSSLAYLTDLPASELKLDRAFTLRVLGEPRTADIVAATVGLAHRLGLRVVAEGVEDGATLEVLARLGVDETQGYLHARPMPPAEFEGWLGRRPAAAAAGARLG
ncbi:putative bifunctional diguanylate cyclase/phosphodiesterase [Kineococcus rubinsiae]|uniref:putative bifunctional diguanylate cyclase/phosphodiesterase n=1 Tax=Kineococcus rubinsiae TaxID=2609562 RepID=UPI001431D562|nr:bifunctional diguanylate cyclase/phosphodiesterase [Kineococcus rubinsiae]NIZ90758.1 bifunctional diguanylate cyclase/phosphodiesterase [Kineococcus rubinsiae]